MNVVILIPTYNEEGNIVKLLEHISTVTKKIKKHKFIILVMDDNSPDGTGKLVQSFAKKRKNVHLLSGKKRGLGVAMRRGYQHAINRLKADVVVSNEADFAFSFRHLPKMITKIEDGYDVVVASRHVGIGRTKGWTINRRVNHWIANTFFARHVAGVTEVYDKNGAFRAVRVKGVLDSINLASLDAAGFGFFFYSLYKLTRVTDNFYEIPATYTFRRIGESKVSFNPKYVRTYLRDVAEYVKLAITVRNEKRKNK